MTSTVKKGDRITLRGTVLNDVGTGVANVRFDGAAEGEWNTIRREALAHAKIEERPLVVGDKVTRNSENGMTHQPVYGIAVMDAHFAALTGRDSELIPEPPVALSDLTRIEEDPALTANPATVPEGWIPWEGGGFPDIPHDARVDVRYRDGSSSVQPALPARTWDWSHNSTPSDITAYRIVPPAAAAPNPPTEDLYRHKKRGTTYRLLGIGRMQVTNWFKEQWQHADRQSGNPPLRTLDSVDMAEVTIYQSTADGSLWVRPKAEFEDGRFEKAASAPKGQTFMGIPVKVDPSLPPNTIHLKKE